jgi:hypothetical protein
MTSSEAVVPGASTTCARLVCVLVERLDLRAVRAVEYAAHVPATHRCALHVAGDAVQAERLGMRWMDGDMAMPLEVVDDAGGLASSVVAWLGPHLAAGQFDEVVVVVPRLVLRSRWRRLLHDRTSDEIEFALRILHDVRIVVLGVEPADV